MRRLILLAAVALLGTAAGASAGPVFGRIRENRAERQEKHAGGCQSAPVAQTAPAPKGDVRTPSNPFEGATVTCSNGSCPAGTASTKRGLFGFRR